MAFSPKLLQQGASGASTGYQISRSLRFNSADSAYLSRTPASTSSQTTATFSAWVKRSRLGSAAENRMFAESTGSGAGLFWVLFTTSDQIQILVNGSGTGITTTQVFRDPSAYYHVVVAVDTNQTTSSNRIKLYVNGSQVTDFTGTQTYYSLNQTLKFNVTTTTNYIGYSNSQAFDGYMTEVNWIDGQQLTPSSFGETNAQTGVWQPKAYSGSYGTNGFELNFSDNSNTTAATLGKDYSGNGNNFTPSGFIVTAGAGNDSLVDSPTSFGTDTGVGGTVRGNYATLNPLFVPLAGAYFALSNGNLDITGTSSADSGDSIGTISTGISGKYYFEVNITSIDGTGYGIVGASDINQTVSASVYNYIGYLTKSYGYNSSGVKTNSNTNSAYGSSYTNGDVIGVAIDCDNGAIYFSKNNTWQNSGVPTSGSSRTGAAFTWTGGSQDMVPQMAVYKTGTTLSDNFGQRVFSYTAPSGFKALCTQNLPTPTIGATTATQAGKFFAPVLYTGNSSTNTITGVGFQPDWTWLKRRDNTYSHVLQNAVTGVTKYLYANLTDAEGTYSLYIQSWNSDGFVLGSGDNASNNSGSSYVAWNWRASNTTAVSNTSGSITSLVSASTTSGFSVVTYTGNNTAGATVGHGLGVAPSMIIVKGRAGTSGADHWAVYHASLGATQYLNLNQTLAATTSSFFWNNTNPSSTVWTNGSGAQVNNSSTTYVAYCFAPIAGYSAFGSYTGNGNTNRRFVHLGFTPAVILVKRTSSSGTNWRIVNPRRVYLSPNTSDAEYASYPGPFLQTANGFEISGGDDVNENGGTFIYAAFASVPFKFSLAQ